MPRSIVRAPRWFWLPLMNVLPTFERAAGAQPCGQLALLRHDPHSMHAMLAHHNQGKAEHKKAGRGCDKPDCTSTGQPDRTLPVARLSAYTLALCQHNTQTGIRLN